MVRDLRSRLKIKDLYRFYVVEKKSLEDIARLYGVSRVAIWKYCQTAGLTTRNRSEARLEAQKRGKVPQQYFHINETFFSKWSCEMAYVLGLLLTDGCLARAKNGSYAVRLCLNDLELLKRVAKAMGSEHRITASKHQNGLYLFFFARQKMVQDLLKLGMKPRKSLDLVFPDVPGEYLKDFVRGVFDGDGSVYFNAKSKTCPLVTKFVSGSKNFIYGLERKLYDLGMPSRNIYEQKGKNLSYMFKYGHNNSIKLLHLLYHTEIGPGALYLERKYDKFKEGAGINGQTG